MAEYEKRVRELLCQLGSIRSIVSKIPEDWSAWLCYSRS